MGRRLAFGEVVESGAALFSVEERGNKNDELVCNSHISKCSLSSILVSKSSSPFEALNVLKSRDLCTVPTSDKRSACILFPGSNKKG